MGLSPSLFVRHFVLGPGLLAAPGLLGLSLLLASNPAASAQPAPYPPYGSQGYSAYGPAQPAPGYGSSQAARPPAYGGGEGYPQQVSAFAQPAYAQQPYAQQPYTQQSYGYGMPQGYPQPAYAQRPSAASGYPQAGYAQPQAAAQGWDAAHLEQLVAPIALYPDALVAQVLAASTYPAQVAEADRWLAAQGNASAYDIAGGADGQPWDPSVKALTAFPQVLAELDRNLRWTSDLGTAYYNQPGDVLEAVQILRQRAQAAGTLRSTPQELVQYNAGAIQLAPPTSQVVYVPQYNPWTAYGEPVAPYPGFSLLDAVGSVLGTGLNLVGSGLGALGASPLQWGLGIAMQAFNHTPWGFVGWGLSWLTQEIFFNHAGYASHSASVADWGLPYGGPRAFGRARESWGGRGGFTSGRGGGYENGGHAPRPLTAGAGRGSLEAFNRMPAPVERRGGDGRTGYGAGFTGGQRGFAPAYGAAASERSYSAPQGSYRAPSSGGIRGFFGERAGSSAWSGSNSGRNYNSGGARFSDSYGKAPKSGGFHLFGGGGSSSNSSGFKQPKFSGGGHWGTGGGGHSSSGFSGSGHSSSGHSGGGGLFGGHSGGSGSSGKHRG